MITGIPVVAAILVNRQGAVLLARRRLDQPRGGHWELPGGKIIEGESETAALKREIREELAINCEPMTRLGQYGHTYPEIEIDLRVWICECPTDQTPRLSVHDEIGYFSSLHEIQTLLLSPADRAPLDDYFNQARLIR